VAKKRDRAKAARAIEDFLAALGHEPKGELEGTGERVAAAWIDELLSGEDNDPIAILKAGSLDLGEGEHGVVVIRDIATSTVCPHHLLPSHGVATIAYLPKRKAAGLGTLSETTQALARRLTLQETLGEDIAKVLLKGLDAKGALCQLELTHTCFVARGERQAHSVVSTLALAGSFAAEDRDLALAVITRGGRSVSSSQTQDFEHASKGKR
jgi:GTP cyclohydrolase I